MKILIHTSIALVTVMIIGCKRQSNPSPTQFPRAATVANSLRELSLDLGKNVPLKMVWLPAAEFSMGTPNHAGLYDAAHPVVITRPFYIGIHEITQEQYAAVMGNNPSFFKGPQRPVDQVSWFDAQEFCERLSQRVGHRVRLPTEAEWEYACRSSSKTRYCFGDDPQRLKEYGWCVSELQTHVVGQKTANAFGLFDMHGNVSEWCLDWYEPFPAARQVDPIGPPNGRCRIVRGGDYLSSATQCESSNRDYKLPKEREMNLGFRIVME